MALGLNGRRLRTWPTVARRIGSIPPTQTKEANFIRAATRLTRGHLPYCFTSSTRRFFARPSSVALSATGLVSAKPCDIRRAASMPCATSHAATAAAGRCARGWFVARGPALSVCPSIRSSKSGRASRSSCTSGRRQDGGLSRIEVDPIHGHMSTLVDRGAQRGRVRRHFLLHRAYLYHVHVVIGTA